MQQTDVIFLSLFCLALSATFLFLGRKSRHHWYIKSADKTLKRLRAIPHPAQRIAYLRKVNPYVFEEIILGALANNGYLIKRNKRYSGDGGIDGRCSLYGEKYLIQAKRYSGPVKKEHVVEFDILCRKVKVKGLFVHTGTTPRSIVDRLGSEITHVEIISGSRLDRLITPSPRKKTAH